MADSPPQSYLQAAPGLLLDGAGRARLLPERDMKFSALPANLQQFAITAKERPIAAADWDTTLDRALAHRTSP